MKFFFRLRLAIKFFFVYLWELTESNFHVAYDVMTPKKHYDPGLIVLHVDLESDFQVLLLANLVTMTPGTICTDYKPETKELELHLMYTHQKDVTLRRIHNVYVPIIKELIP